MKPYYSNCLFYVLKQFFTKGGYIIFRRTNYTKVGTRGFWLHALWSPDMRSIYQFVPVEGWRNFKFPPPLFKGYVKITRRGKASP
jgi:hypothetical protein